MRRGPIRRISVLGPRTYFLSKVVNNKRGLDMVRNLMDYPNYLRML